MISPRNSELLLVSHNSKDHLKNSQFAIEYLAWMQQKQKSEIWQNLWQMIIVGHIWKVLLFYVHRYSRSLIENQNDFKFSSSVLHHLIGVKNGSTIPIKLNWDYIQWFEKSIKKSIKLRISNAGCTSDILTDLITNVEFWNLSYIYYIRKMLTAFFKSKYHGDGKTFLSFWHAQELKASTNCRLSFISLHFICLSTAYGKPGFVNCIINHLCYHIK